MERFDDKNSLKGGFFAIYGAYIETPPPPKKNRKKQKKRFMNYSYKL